MEVIDNKTNNLYIIKRRLADLKLLSGGYYEYTVGDFCVQIHTHRVQEQPQPKNIVTCDVVDVSLREKTNKNDYNFSNYIKVGNDARFNNYKPIQYEGYNHYDLIKMPLINLCELIKYLHKLSNLAVFA